jgi:hypothetical protein
MRLWRFVGTGALAVGTIAGAALAAQPTKEDMDFCDQKAAQVSKAAPVQPGAGTTPPSTPQPGSNSTGGRATDGTQSPSQPGMAPIGEDPVYRQTYLACIHERAK